MKRKNPTIRDVAAAAGVSHQTVSRVINNDPRVTAETREKVEEAIQSLGFRPNAIARIMATGVSLMLACISPNLTDYTFSAIIEGAETEARAHGYFLISASAPDSASFEALIEQLVASRRADGLLVINPYADDRHLLLPANIPTVFVGARPRDLSISSVSLDDVGAAQMATQLLVNLGHTRIAQILGPQSEDCVQDRKLGYETTLLKAGLQPDEKLSVEGDWSATSGFRAASQLLEQNLHFSAIFAQNDRMAVGAIDALRQAGLSVPDDISVIGFDDMPLASYFDPPLTTVHQDIFAIGQEAARLLIQSLEKPGSKAAHRTLPARLVIRRSTRMPNKTKGGEVSSQDA